MCLAKIGKRTMGEEGYGWKTFLKIAETGEIYTLIRECLILPDCWLLNQEPSKGCSCGVRYRNTLEDLKNRHRAGLAASQFSPYLTFNTGTSAIASTQFPECYEHGFHLWKECKEGVKTKHGSQPAWIIPALAAGDIKIFHIKVFYKGYIAEDDNQIVSKQIYVPISTLSPTDISKVYEVNKREYVTV